jgi:hypothetical protein
MAQGPAHQDRFWRRRSARVPLRAGALALVLAGGAAKPRRLETVPWVDEVTMSDCGGTFVATDARTPQ